MYGKDRKRYLSLKLSCGSDVPFTLVVLRTMLKTRSFDTFEEVRNSTIGSASAKKRQQLYSEIFEWFLAKGGLEGVSQSVEGSIRADAELPT